MKLPVFVSISVLIALGGHTAGATTLDTVRAHGALRCGFVETPEDWNKDDLHGALSPLDLEMCKAVAVTALGAQAKVEAKKYDSETDAKDGLGKSEVDIVMGLTPDATSMWHWHIAFGPPIFYDGQAVMVRADSTAASFQDLGGMSICVVEGTDNERQLQAQAHIRGVKLAPDAFQEEGEMEDAIVVRHCDGVSAYISRIAQIRMTYPKDLGKDKILADVLTLSPVTPAYRRDDPQWGMIVDWTIHALVQAEASGITQANLAGQGESEDIIAQRLLGIDWAVSRALGLKDHDWAAQVINVVGNYGEIYDRTVGLNGSLQLPRGLNALWLNGGLMHPLPIQ